MSSASQGLAPREGLECLLVKMGRTGPLTEPRRGPQAGKSGAPVPRTPTGDFVKSQDHMLAHSLEGAHRARVCMCGLIAVSACAYI